MVPGLNRLRPRSVSGPAIVMTVAVVVALCTFIHRKPALLGVEPGSPQQMYWMAGVIAAGVVFLIIMGVYHLLNRHAAVQNFELRRQLAAGDDYRAVTTKKADSRHPAMVELAAFLRDRYGPFWRRNVRLLLVTGEPEQAEAIAPGLTGQHWLEGDHTVLIYGGRPTAEPDVTLLTALKKLRRSRPLDGIIWPLTEEQSRQTAQLDKGWRGLINGGKRLGFQAPLYLWQVCDDGDYQTGRPLQSVGCLLPERCTPEQLAVMLEAQTLPLTEQGMSQLLTNNRHDFLLRLAHTLAERGIAHWQSVLKPLLAGGAFSSLRLRGLMFSPPLAAVPEAAPHAWLPSPVWAGVTGDNARGRTVGFPWLRTALMSAVCVLVIWGPE